MQRMKSHPLAARIAALFAGILLASFLAQENAPEKLLLPYLQAVTTTSISVMVESTTQEPVFIEYGTESGPDSRAGTSEVRTTTAPSYIHVVRLERLIPGTRYRYRVIRGQDTTAIASFRTATADLSPVRFAWMADVRTGRAVHDVIARRIRKAAPMFSLYGGDLSWNGTYESLRKEFFRAPQQALISEVPFFNAVGNHEGWGSAVRAMFDEPVTASGTRDYYSFDYGPVHILVLNTEVDHAPGSDQWRFADRDLERLSRPWRIVVAHEPGYAPGGHEDDDMLKLSEMVFGPRKPDLFIAGHSHFYQHNVLHGVHQLIIGAAGSPLHDPKKGEHTVKFAKEYNYAIADADTARLRIVVYNERGSVLDSLVLTK